MDDGRGNPDVSGLLGGSVKLDMSPAEGLRAGGIRKATRIGINRAASPVKATVVAAAEGVRRFGFLAKSIRIRVRQYPADRWAAIIGPSTKYQRKKGTYKRGKRAGQPRISKPSKYAHLVERGTKRSRARPWLKPAHAAAAPRYLSAVGPAIGGAIQDELRRLAAKLNGGVR